MDYRYLEVFHRVATNKSFIGAAKDLAISPSAISRQIRLLENSCGRQLLRRSPKSVSLTEHGERLLSSLELFNSSLSQHGFRESRTVLRIGALEGLLESYLIAMIIALSQKREWDLYIDVDSPNNLMQRLERGRLDIIFTSPVNETPIPDDFVCRAIGQEKIVLISREPVDLKEVQKYPWICFEPNTWITRFTKKHPKKTIRVNNMLSIIGLVKAGVGIAMIPEHCIKNRKGLKVQSVSKFKGAEISAILPQKDFRPNHLQMFFEEFVINSTIKT